MRKRKLAKTFEKYNGYMIVSIVYQLDTSYEEDKRIVVFVMEPSPLWMRWLCKTLGDPYRQFVERTTEEDMESKIREVRDSAKYFIDNRLRKPDI